jgi:hypothetical protein
MRTPKQTETDQRKRCARYAIWTLELSAHTDELATSGARIDSDNNAVLEFESECGCTVYNLDLHLTMLIIRPLLQESSRLHIIYFLHVKPFSRST